LPAYTNWKPTSVPADASTGLSAALVDWSNALGESHVRLNDPAAPSEGLRTFGRPAIVPATILPGSADEVAEAVRIAARHGIGLHPVSRGCNWGLGSRAPNRDGDVVIDLSRLDRISGFDPRDGVVHVEPGVTFRQLFEFLSTQESDFFLPTIGGPVMASVLANALDRGDAVFCDRWKSISDLSVVLPDGTMLETGHGEGSPLAGRGVPLAGPLIEGLFSQSGFGIVTGAWLRLEPLPGNISAWLIDVGSRDHLPDFVSAWRDLQRTGTVPDRSLILWNGIKFLARNGRRADYDAAEIEAAQLDRWQCSGFVVGESAAVLVAREELMRTRLAAAGTAFQRFDIRTNGQWCEDAEGVFATPRQTNLRTVYWRHAEPPQLDTVNPDRDGCGLIWLCLALPLDGSAIRDFSIWCRNRLQRADMDFNIGLEGASFRTALAYLTLSYTRSAAADASALQCYDDILAHALALGFQPYRLANGIATQPASGNETRARYLKILHKNLDSQGLIARTKG
jgi:4-cresol dehydrogenase (hydroxylating)